jgi:hypothetical protein
MEQMTMSGIFFKNKMDVQSGHVDHCITLSAFVCGLKFAIIKSFKKYEQQNEFSYYSIFSPRLLELYHCLLAIIRDLVLNFKSENPRIY